MASGRMEFHADTIMQHANFTFVLPNDVEMAEVRDLRHYQRPAGSLILLHGLTGTDTDWLFGGVAQQIAIQYNLAVFMPSAANSFYLDRGYRGGNFASFVGQELPEYIRKVFGYCESRETTMIAGLSMGGFGALHTALAFPEHFSSCIALSPALALYEIAETGKRKDGVMPEKMIRDVFGDPEKLLESEKNPEYLYRRCIKAGKPLPRIYMAIGTEDSLYDCNQRFRAFLEKEKADFRYEDGPGRHDWFFWNEYIEKGLSWILE
ncbi:MAG: acetylesterase [Lachnospiraceae bacterium]|nr:acetylesterase [Lachnospiraceae bacterium]